MGYVLLCSEQQQHVNSVLSEPCLCLCGLGGGRAAGPASDSGTDAVHEWEHSLPFPSPASLSLRVGSCAAAPSQARRKRLPLSSFPSTPVSL